jgi:hypothetical protein
MINPFTHSKPRSGQSCNGCGYCCTVAPCMLANTYLNCTSGPCVALEHTDGRSSCGLVRNPLGYLFQAANPDSSVSVLDPAPDLEAGHHLSVQIAAALGVGQGCDSDDTADAVRWPSYIPATNIS